MNNITTRLKEQIINLFKKDLKTVIIGHHNPDGDAIGGSLGLFRVLKNAGNNVSVLMPNQASDFLKWMPDYNQIKFYDIDQSLVINDLNSADIIVCVDFNEFSRVKDVEETLKNATGIKILIDHHPMPDKSFDYIFSYTHVSSASEIVYDFIQMIEYYKYIDLEAALSLFTGIMTDTINFSVNSSRPETFNIVADLLSFGIDKDDIYDKVYNNFSEDRMRLVGYLMHNKLKILKEFKLAYILLSEDDMKRFNFIEGDHEGIVNMPLSVSGIFSSIIAIEKKDHVKLSSRSKNALDVNLLSRKYFNGGGHKNAAGGTLYMPLDEVETFIIDSVKEFLKTSV